MIAPRWLRERLSTTLVWPGIEYEILDHRRLLGGLVLNAGAGSRDLAPFVSGRVVNLDIPHEQHEATIVDVFATLERLPFPDASYDAVLSIAVLEHVAEPDAVMLEMHRVLKSGGHLIISVPFMQPEHKIPTDFQRYTRDGLERLATRAGFDVVESKTLFTVYHTLHWIAVEWLRLRESVGYRCLRLVVLPLLALAARRGSLQSDTLASAFQVVARKRA